MPSDKLPEPGEFTRIFKRQHMSGHGGGSGGETKGDDSSSGGNSSPAPLAAPPPPAPVPSRPADLNKTEPGEFTQYFMGGVPRSAPKSAPPAGPTREPSGVQRPNSPHVFRTTESTGSFTERFGTAAARSAEPVAPPARSASPFSQAGADTGPFDYKAAVPQPPASKADSPSEYTALFGKGNTPPPARQAAVSQTPAAPIMGDAPYSVPPPSLPRRSGADFPAADLGQRGPSEFTMIARGRDGAAEPPAAVAQGASAGADSGGARRSPVHVNLNPVNPLTGLGGMPMQGASAQMSMSGASMNTPLGSVNMQAPAVPQAKLPGDGGAIARMSPQTKLILFFATLAILAVILVVAVVATQKN